VDPVEELALTKAVAEAFERSLFKISKHRLDVCGIAVHTDFNQAAENAQLELIERDSFFCHYFTSTPFLKLIAIEESRCGAHFKAICLESGIEVAAYLMSSPIGYYSIALVLKGNHSRLKPFGTRIGLGCSKLGIEDALQKALLEALPMLAVVVLSEDFESISSSELLSEPNPGPELHRKWALHIDSVDSMNCLTATGSLGDTSHRLDVNAISIVPIERPSEWPFIIPLVAAGANHPKAVKTVFGKNENALKYFTRLSDFVNNSKFQLNLPSQPHPLG
jgi:hypothetical protein